MKDVVQLKVNVSSGGLIISAMVISFALHMLAFGTFVSFPGMRIAAKRPMQVKLNAKAKEIKAEPLKKVKIPPKDPPKTERPKEPAIKKTPDNARPVAGLNANSFSDKGAGFVAPAGNTLMMADSGVRLSPDQIAALKDDLSSEPQLILTSVVKPDYTQDAIDAGFEGRLVIDVYVDATGKVVQAELARPVGYQMDGRILEMARAARFIPRKNPVGQPIAGWGQIKVTLTLD